MHTFIDIILWIMIAPFAFMALFGAIGIAVMAVRGAMSGGGTLVSLVEKARPKED